MPKEINISDNKKSGQEVSKPAAKTEIKEHISKQTSIQETTLEEAKTSEVAKVKKEKKPLKKWAIALIAAGSVLLVGGGLFAFYYFGIFKFVKDPSEVTEFPTNYLKPSTDIKADEELIKLPQPGEPRTEESPLNGELFTIKEMEEMEKRRPVAVMINNHVQARPQSGLNSADIVYEALTESGITRYMAIFWSRAPEKVGSIRSARNYFLQWLSPYDALYIHDGCAQSDNPEANACGNLYTYGIKDIGTAVSWRWNDGIRYAPHNEYTSITNAWEYGSNLDWDEFPDIESWSFKRDATAEDRGEKGIMQITFHTRLTNGGDYDVRWTYDPDTNTYLRRVGGEIDIDQETNTQVWAKNIVIQEVDTSPAYDDTAHIIIKTIDKGNATFLIDGQIIEGTWEKKSRTDRTTYYDKDGKEIQFNRGRIWIEAVSTEDGRFDIIEQ